ncbi:hypothetical protein RhiJN_27438 [Ceratobasidium sp. AG-Ba]|nr:hypothetical protein RhiJN_13373 [Ceratobasidium sp. AG-Ba]QRV99419.1 hypothetical protein RhiJN_27438 [Ceratobasidium sp. AG-Ba]QRW13926.1 hypothetical protein RhiLY_12925 [Ceratobasidium sp. AG-Ba]
MPECFGPAVEKDECYGFVPSTKRNYQRPPFILETLQEAAMEQIKANQDRLSAIKDRSVIEKDIDQDLIQSLKAGEKRALRFGFHEDLEKIRSHVDNYRRLFRNALGNRGIFRTSTPPERDLWTYYSWGMTRVLPRALEGI